MWYSVATVDCVRAVERVARGIGFLVRCQIAPLLPVAHGLSDLSSDLADAYGRQHQSTRKRDLLMSTRIYVGNLPYSATSEQVAQLFATYGEVSEALVVTDRDTGRNKGFGFVTMADDNAARTAIEALRGAQMDDRAIRVDVAQPRAEGSTRSNDRPRRSSSDDRRW
jgi:cold-inducible RNA-binding protein